MKPFICTSCDFGWVAEGSDSFCEFCGRPGFTYSSEYRNTPSMAPSDWNFLMTAAKNREKESR